MTGTTAFRCADAPERRARDSWPQPIANDVWQEVVIPLIEVKNTALIAISTPLDSSNFYSTLVEMKDDRGERVFEVLEARAGAAKVSKESLESFTEEHITHIHSLKYCLCLVSFNI